MDTCVSEPYTVVYFHDPMLTKHADFWGLRKWGNILPRKYYDNLQTVFVVAPPAMFKAEVALLYPFFNKILWARMVYLRAVEDLDQYMDITQLKLPEETLKAAFNSLKQKENEVSTEEATATTEPVEPAAEPLPAAAPPPQAAGGAPPETAP